MASTPSWKILDEIIGPDQASIVTDQIPEKILRGELVERKQITESPPSRPSLISRLFKRKV
jgi:hypothetical protein